MQEVGKVKIELQSSQTKLENERAVQRDLRDKMAEADNKLSGMCNDLCLVLLIQVQMGSDFEQVYDPDLLIA